MKTDILLNKETKPNLIEMSCKSMTLTGTTTLGHSETRSNSNEGVFYTPQNSRTEVSPSDAV